jgi:HD-like signal output (HDOD) protein
MPTLSLSDFQRRVEGLNELPSLPVILFPVLNQLNADADSVDLQQAAQLIAHDGALSTQILHMANSPLFGIRNRITSVRTAALTLGVSRLRDIVTSCCLMQILPRDSALEAATFWEHSLACALVSRSLARKLNYPDAERAYLAGLVHDLGILVNMLLVPREFTLVFKAAAESRRPLREVELEQIGISHELTGDLLAAHWHLFDYLSEVMRRHHDVENATLDPAITAIVNIADLFCRTSGLGYGYEENIVFTLENEPAWKILAAHSSQLRTLDIPRFKFDVEGYIKEVRTLVSVLFRI